jgi:Ca-activated chloride channel family protein
MQNILNNTKKPIVFCLSAAIGCFLFALLAELFLSLTAGKPVETTPQNYVLTIDVSGSMAGSKMDEIKRAAKAFVDRSQKPVALTVFSSVGNALSPFTSEKTKLADFIGKLEPYGGTNFEDAMRKTEDTVRENPQKPAVLLFTDGAPSTGDPQKGVEIAYNLRKAGVKIYCVATKDADMDYLTALTGHADRVITAADGRIEEAFKEAEQKMNQSLMGSGSSSVGMTFFRVSVWTVFLCIGIALALVMVQNFFLKKPMLSI